jgi:RNA polymerase sigma factor (sigma-70 family)
MDDGELARRLAAGDPEAFAALLTDHAPRMMAYATALVRSRQAGEDAVSDLIAKWFERPPMITGALVPFLLRSVKNAVIDAERRRKKETGQHPRTPTGIAPPDRRKRGALVERRGDESDEAYDAICEEALASLSANDRQVLELATRTMTTKEMADELKKSTGAFHKQLHDARGRLVKAMDAVRARRAGRE